MSSSRQTIRWRSSSIRRSASALSRSGTLIRTDKWYLWQRREDWQRTSVARLGEPRSSMPCTLLQAQRQARACPTAHQLDVIHDCTPAGRITLAKQSPTSVGWFPSFPWAHPDPTLPAVIYNHEKPGMDKKEVRWALTLAIDIVQVALAPTEARPPSPASMFRRPACTPTTIRSRWNPG